VRTKQIPDKVAIPDQNAISVIVNRRSKKIAMSFKRLLDYPQIMVMP
jgi:hypothetical protein